MGTTETLPKTENQELREMVRALRDKLAEAREHARQAKMAWYDHNLDEIRKHLVAIQEIQ